jgi:hypothetical protein
LAIALSAPALADPPKKKGPVRATKPAQSQQKSTNTTVNNGNRAANRNFNGGGGGGGGGNANRNNFQRNNFQRAGGAGTGQKAFSNPAASQGVSAARFRIGPGHGRPAFARPANFQFVKLGSHIAPISRSGPRRIWWRGGWRTFVPLTALGVVALGGAYYYADAYLSVARPYCTGITPDGCRLNWQQVGFDNGDGGEWQCVQYCPRPGQPPPARTVALVSPPPAPQGGACEISIFSEPNFAGTNATASDEQPNLDEIGWQNQIASVQVQSGTWDFFSDQQFTGETMRLGPGQYADLGPQWAKKAGSFMCVQQ